MKGKTILIILSLIGFITVGVLLITKIGDIGKMQASVSNKKSYFCTEGWTLSGNKCTKTVSATYECASGYTYSSMYSLCYKKASRNASDYYCKSGETLQKQLPGVGTYLCTKARNVKGCTTYQKNGITATKNGNNCKLTKDAKEIDPNLKNGLIQADDGFYYLVKNGKVVVDTGWYDDNYYEKGKQVIGLKNIGKNWYYFFDKKPDVVALLYRWIEVPDASGNKSKFRYGYNNKYYLKNGSYKIAGITYKFDENGYCVSTNCSKISSKDLIKVEPVGLKIIWINNCHYAGGYPITGLNKIDGKWYNQTWNKATNKCTRYEYKWHCDKKKKAYWYGYNNKYYLKNGSYKINGTTYKFDKNGYCTGSNCKNEKCK